MIQRPELLAPAGSMEALRAAVDNGADAVYFGIGTMNARANADNISEENVGEAIAYAHLRSTRAYLALNTLLHDDEISEAIRIAKIAYEQGIDALIVQDIGLMSTLKRDLPDLPIHASTQMNIFQKNFGEWAREQGIERVVLPRELSLEEIRVRTSEAARYQVETEVFIHGATCVSYSGLCLFSAMNGNGMRSGNRGLCAQPCRTKLSMYSSDGKVKKIGRLLSPKDNSAIDSLYDLISAGVKSLKIEGRMRDAAYTGDVVRVYRNEIDRILSGDISSREEEKEHLLLAFNRGGDFTSQYLQGKKSPDFLSGDYPGRFGRKIGYLIKKEPKSGILYVRIETPSIPNRGDYISIRDRNIEIASFPIGSVEVVGDTLMLKGLHPQMIEKIPDAAGIYRMSDKNRERDILSGKDSRKTPVDVRVFASDERIRIALSVADGMWMGSTVDAGVDLVANESFPELSRERFTEQISKMKSSPFAVKNVSFATDATLKIPVSLVNELRRMGIATLTEEISSLRSKKNAAQRDQIHPLSDNPVAEDRTALSGIHVHYQDLSKIESASLAVGADVYSFSPYDMANHVYRDSIEALIRQEPEARIYLWLPGAYSDTMQDTIDTAVQNAGELCGKSFRGFVSGILSDISPEDIVSPSANLYNSYSVEWVSERSSASVHLSLELNEREIEEIIDANLRRAIPNFGLSLHRYGRIDWMQTAFCPVGNNAQGCQRCKDRSKAFYLQVLSQETDEPISGKTLPIITHPEDCSCEILGPVMTPASDALVKNTQNKGVPVLQTLHFWNEDHALRQDIISRLKNDL